MCVFALYRRYHGRCSAGDARRFIFGEGMSVLPQMAGVQRVAIRTSLARDMLAPFALARAATIRRNRERREPGAFDFRASQLVADSLLILPRVASKP
jgi:hypothetical protein